MTGECVWDESYQAPHVDRGASTILSRVCQVASRTGAGTDTIVGARREWIHRSPPCQGVKEKLFGHDGSHSLSPSHAAPVLGA